MPNIIISNYFQKLDLKLYSVWFYYTFIKEIDYKENCTKAQQCKSDLQCWNGTCSCDTDYYYSQDDVICTPGNAFEVKSYFKKIMYWKNSWLILFKILETLKLILHIKTQKVVFFYIYSML